MEGAHAAVLPDENVVPGVADHDRFAGGAAGTVETHDVVHRAGEETERILVAQVGFHHERQ